MDKYREHVSRVRQTNGQLYRQGEKRFISTGMSRGLASTRQPILVINVHRVRPLGIKDVRQSGSDTRPLVAGQLRPWRH